jgi:hypothetical protein
MSTTNFLTGRLVNRPPRGPAFVTPANPTLFLAAGPLACRAVENLAAVARSLHVRISGPFGYLNIAGQQGTLQRRSGHSPALPPIDTSPGQQAESDAEWQERLLSMLRRLRPLGVVPWLGSEVGGGGGGGGIQVYAIFDLGDEPAVAAGLQAVRDLRKEPMPLDVTGVLLTGRTATFRVDEERWRRPLRLLLQQCEEECLLHRIYFMDGHDACKHWLQTEEDHARMAAELVFHHGLSPYRDLLRRREQTRLSAEQPLHEVCGAFACRTMRSDRAAIARPVAEVIHRHLFPGAGYLLPADQVGQVHLVARDLGKALRGLFEKRAGASAEELAGPVHALLGEALRTAGKGGPRERLRYFLEALLPELKHLETVGQIIDRVHQRRAAASEVLALLPPPPLPVEPPPPEPAPPFWKYVAAAVLGVMGLSLAACGLWSGLSLFVPILGAALVAAGLVCALLPAKDPPPEPRPKRPERRPPPRFEFRPVGAAMSELLAPLRSWCHALTAQLEQSSPNGTLAWPASREAGTILDAMVSDWRERLAKRCLQDLEPSVRDEERWAELLLSELVPSEVEAGSLEEAFCLHAVDDWLAARSWEELLELLEPDPRWLQRFFEQAVAPQWSEGAQNLHFDAGVVAYDKQLCPMLGPDNHHDATYRLAPVDWPQAGTVVFVRIVQGLPAHWWFTADPAANGVAS